MSGSPRVNLVDAFDPFVDAHMRWCASPEELRSMQDSLANITASAPPAPLPVEIPEISPPVLSEPSATNGSAPAAPSFNEQSVRDDTFRNAVIRSDR